MYKSKQLRFIASLMLIAIIASCLPIVANASQLSVYGFAYDNTNGAVKATGGNQLNVHSGTDYFHDFFATLRTDRATPSTPANINYKYRIDVYGNNTSQKIYESPDVHRMLFDPDDIVPCHYNTGTQQVSRSSEIHTMISKHYVYHYGTFTLFCPTITVTAYGSDVPN